MGEQCCSRSVVLQGQYTVQTFHVAHFNLGGPNRLVEPIGLRHCHILLTHFLSASIYKTNICHHQYLSSSSTEQTDTEAHQSVLLFCVGSARFSHPLLLKDRNGQHSVPDVLETDATSDANCGTIAPFCMPVGT